MQNTSKVYRMLNYLWAGMILIGIIFAAFTGRMPDITNAALDSSKEAITLCITMMGVMSFWVGLMEIAGKAGIIRAASIRIRPLVRFLFPGLPANHPAEEHITTNIIANVLGLGGRQRRRDYGRWKSFLNWKMSEEWVECLVW